MSDKMTVRQIASTAGCNHKTVRKTVEELFPGRAQNGIRLEFTRQEAIKIMEKLPKRAMIEKPSQEGEGQLPENGKALSAKRGSPRLPSGAQLRELRLMAEKDKISRDDLRELLGLPLVIVSAKPRDEKAAPAIAEKGFGQLRLIAENGPETRA